MKMLANQRFSSNFAGISTTLTLMKHFKIIYLIAVIFTGLSLSSCEDSPKYKAVRQMTLVYAVNNNNLSADLTANESQMLKAMQDVDPEVYKLLVYKYTSDGPALYEVSNDGNGGREFVRIKEYDNTVLSASAERLGDVIEDALQLYPDVESSLFFWGHGNGWVNPNKYSNSVSPSSSSTENTVLSHTLTYSYEDADFTPSVALPEAQSFGGEYYYDNGTRKSEYIDIDLLADAIPDNTFDLIWFDCCYMSSIEVAYQLRNKCSTMVAYPTEIMAEGLPYNKVLPNVIGPGRNIRNAANALYEYYTGKSTPEPVTVAVMNMNKIGAVAEAARGIFTLGDVRPSVSNMQNYSRFYGTPYYDFGQYLREYASANGVSQVETSALEKALKEFVVYSAASDVDFTYPVGKPILPENYSGLSIHPYNGVNTYREDFYRTLDWFGAVWR